MATHQSDELDLEKLKTQIQNEGSATCPVAGCTETFKSIWSLRFHLAKNSCNTPKFKCDKCDGIFRTRIVLHQHTASCGVEASGNEVVDSQRNNETTGLKRACLQGDSELPANKKAKIPESVEKDLPSVFVPSGETTSSVSMEVVTPSNTTQGHTVATMSSIIAEGNTSLQQGSETVKKKRGRPRKSDSASHGQIVVKNPSYAHQETMTCDVADTTNISTPGDTATNLQQSQGSVTPRKKPGRPKTAKLETPKSNESSLATRRSSRSKLKKVNYAQFDDSDCDDSYDDDDSTDYGRSDTTPPQNTDQQVATSGDSNTATSVKDTETPKRRRGRPKKKVIVVDDDENIADNSGRTGKDTESNDAVDSSGKFGSTEEKHAEIETKEHADDNNDGRTIVNEQRMTTNVSVVHDNGDNGTENAAEQRLEIKDESSKAHTKTKRTKAKGKPKSNNIETALKNKLKYGQRISCLNKCGKKFTTLPGYKAHMNVCGKALQVIKCDLCAKEYTTEAGLKYHMKAVHEVKKEEYIDEEEKPKDDELNGDETETPRRLRKAAARALKKVQDLKKDTLETTTTPFKSRRGVLDGYISQFREGLVTSATMNGWREEIKKNSFVKCPNEDCEKEFTSCFILQTHYLQCGFEGSPFQCKLCDKDFLTIIGARQHVEHSHRLPEDNNKDDDKEVSSPEDVLYEASSDEEVSDTEDIEILESPQDRKRSSNSGPRGRRNSQIMIVVGHMNSTFRENEKWRKVNFTKEVAFGEHIPTIHHWQRVEVSEISDYIPTSSLSPHFVILRPDNDVQKDADDIQLPLFTSLPKDDSGNYGDRTFYTGGPVWGLSWCPIPDTEQSVDQYLVVSTHRSYKTAYHSYKSHKDNGTLQIWNIGTLSNTSSRSGDCPVLALCIAHDYGPIWKMSWCPNGAWQSTDTSTDDDCVSRLGLLAVACGDGIVRILSIPHPDKLLSKLPMYEDNAVDEKQNSSFNRVMVHCTSQVDLYPCPVNVNYKGQRGMALCVDWSVIKPFNRIAAGFSDGTVAVWNLTSQSSLLRKSLGNEQHTLRMAPFVLFNAHASLVRDLALCPSNQDIIVTGSEERAYKIWDLKSPTMPQILLKKGYPYEIEWPLHINGFLYCEQELYQKEQPSLRYCNIPSADQLRLVCHHGCNMWSLSFNKWIDVAASSDITGDVILSKVISQVSSINKWYLYRIHLEDRNSNTEVENTDGTQQQKKDSGKDDMKRKCPSIEETINDSRLVFKDRNRLQFNKMLATNDVEHKQTPGVYRYNSSSLQSIHKVRWNPNKQALTWIASGGASGLVRIHHAKEIKSHGPKPIEDE